MDEPHAVFQGVNTHKTLLSILNLVGTNHPDIDFILFTGDISQTGSEASYSIFQSTLENCPAPYHCVPGNHDDPVRLQNAVNQSPVDRLHSIPVGDCRLHLLSSWIAGSHAGEIVEENLAQLEIQLTDSIATTDIIALHHPPILTGCSLDELGLQNRKALIGILNESPNPTLVLSGHVHQEIDQTFNRTRVLVTPSSCYQFLKGAASLTIDRTQPPGYRYIHLSPSRGIETEVHYLAS